MKYYTVEITNKFALLSDEEESGDERILSAAPPAAIPILAPAAKPAPSPVPRRGRGGAFADRGGQRGGRSDRGGRGAARAVMSPEVEGAVEEDSAEKTNRRVTRDRGIGRARAQHNPAPVRGRDHDRHLSGTGRGKEMKKQGGGAHNWGNEEVAAEDKPEVAVEAETGEDSAPETKAEVPVPEVEKEPEMIDLAEYQRQRAAMRANLPVLPSAPVRSGAATESELTKEGYEKYVKASDRAVSNGEVVDHGEDDAGKRPKAINFFQLAEEQGNAVRLFPAMQGSTRGRGGRGGRGGFRDTPSRKNADERPERRAPHAPATEVTFDLTDEAAFPGLASA